MRFGFNLVLLTKIIADCVDMQVIDSICIEKSLNFNLGRDNSLDRDAHNSD